MNTNYNGGILLPNVALSYLVLSYVLLLVFSMAYFQIGKNSVSFSLSSTEEGKKKFHLIVCERVVRTIEKRSEYH